MKLSSSINVDCELVSGYEFRKLNARAWALNCEFWRRFEKKDGFRKVIYTQLAELVHRDGGGSCREVWGDFACGCASLSAMLLDWFPIGGMYGIDCMVSGGSAVEDDRFTFVRADLQAKGVPIMKPLSRAFCVLSAFEFERLDRLLGNIAATVRAGGRVYVVVLDAAREFERLLFKKMPCGNYRLYMLGQTVVLESYFWFQGARSPAPYYRLLYSIPDFVQAAGDAGMTLEYMTHLGKAWSSSELAPVVKLLVFTVQ